MEDMNKRLEELPKLAQEARKENLKYFQKLKKRPYKRLDLLVQEIHDEEFERTAREYRKGNRQRQDEEIADWKQKKNTKPKRFQDKRNYS